MSEPRSEQEPPCGPSCVDPSCRWFFIHGERTGTFEGIGNAGDECAGCGLTVTCICTRCPLCLVRPPDPNGNRWASAEGSGTLCTECTIRAKRRKRRREAGLDWEPSDGGTHSGCPYMAVQVDTESGLVWFCNKCGWGALVAVHFGSQQQAT